MAYDKTLAGDYKNWHDPGDDGEPVGSCDECGANLYEDDHPLWCDECLCWRAVARGGRDE